MLTTALLSLLLVSGDPCTGPDAPTAPVVNPAVDTALLNIEAKGDPSTFTADIAYRKDEALLGRSEIRIGRVVFEQPEGKQSVLGIGFDTRVLGSRREAERKRIIFENGWLIEIDEARQLTIKRQLVHDGESMDPMRLGGPFPLPVGQKRDDVLLRFAVTLGSTPTHPMFKSIAGTPDLVALHLVPRINTPEADTWTSIDLWYDPATWLPVAVEARETNDDVRRIRLTNATRDIPLKRLDRGVLFSDSPMDDWTVDVRPLPDPEPDTESTGAHAE